MFVFDTFVYLEPDKELKSNGLCSSYLSNFFYRISGVHNYNTRNRTNVHLVKISSKSGYRSFSYSATKLFNDLDIVAKNSHSIRTLTLDYWLKQKLFISF